MFKGPRHAILIGHNPGGAFPDRGASIRGLRVYYLCKSELVDLLLSLACPRREIL